MALKGGEGSASRPGRSLPPGKTRYPMYRRLGGPQGRSGQVRKISPPTGFDPRTVQPVASRYTDWATRPTHDQKSQQIYSITARSTSSVRCSINHRTKYQNILWRTSYRKHYRTASKQCKFTKRLQHPFMELLNYHLQPQDFHIHVYAMPSWWQMSVQQW